MKTKLLRLTTIPISLKILLRGQSRFISQNGFEVIGVSSKGQELDDVHRYEDIPVVILEMTRTISPLKDLKSLWDFYKLCKREKPLMVHSHTPKAGTVGMLGARFAGVPIRLHTVAGLPLMEAKGLKRKMLDIVEKITYACATNVYPNSIGLYNFIIENKYVTKEKLKVIANGSSNGVDTTFFSPEQITQNQQNQLKRDLNISDKDFVFVFVGRLVGDKGINELIGAFSQISKTANQQISKLLLVGSFESQLDKLEVATLQEIEMNPNIICVGYQNDVRPYFSIADVLTFPSYREGFPNVVMQAGAMGLPSIVSDINGCNEIIIENHNGLIVAVKNAIQLEEAMRKILKDTSFKNQLQFNSRKRIVENYEQKVVWEAILKEYKDLEKQKKKLNV